MFEEKLGEIYSKIAETIDETIPENWDKVYMYGEVVEGAKEAYFYYYPIEGDKQPIYSHNIPEIFEINEDDYDELLLRLIDNITELWNEFKNNGQEPWTNFTLTLGNDGEFKIDYDYTDLSDTGPRKRRIIWKYKYLGIMPEDEYDRKTVQEYIQNTENK